MGIRFIWIAAALGLMLPVDAVAQTRPVSIPPAAEKEIERLRAVQEGGDALEARKLATQLERTFESRYGKDSPAYAEAVMFRALSIFYEDGPASLPVFRESLRRYEAALGPQHVDVALALHTLADALDETNGDSSLSEIEGLYRRAFDIRNSALGPQNATTASAALAVARVLLRRAQLDQTRDQLVEADQKAGFAVAIYSSALEDLSNGLAELFEAKVLHARIVVARGDIERGGRYADEIVSWYRALDLIGRVVVAEDFCSDYEEILRGLGRNDEADKLERMLSESEGEFMRVLDKFFESEVRQATPAPDKI